MGNNERQPITTGIKHWGLGGWVAFAPVSWFLSWDTDAPRNPQRFIPATVVSNLTKNSIDEIIIASQDKKVEVQNILLDALKMP